MAGRKWLIPKHSNILLMEQQKVKTGAEKLSLTRKIIQKQKQKPRLIKGWIDWIKAIDEKNNLQETEIYLFLWVFQCLSVYVGKGLDEEIQ